MTVFRAGPRGAIFLLLVFLLLVLLLLLRDDILRPLEDLVLTHRHGQLEQKLSVDGLYLIEGHAVGRDDLLQDIINALHAFLLFQLPEKLLQIVLTIHIHEALASRYGNSCVDVPLGAVITLGHVAEVTHGVSRRSVQTAAAPSHTSPSKIASAAV